MRVASLNVAGRLLTGRLLAALLAWLLALDIDVCFLQEVHCREDPSASLEDAPGAAPTLGAAYSWFFSPAASTARGCATLVRRASALINIAQHADGADGRVLRLDATWGPLSISLVNVYAPATPADRPLFYRDTLPPCLPSPDTPLVLGGDFNCVLDDNSDSFYPSGSPPTYRSRTVGAGQLSDIVTARNLLDVWRTAHTSTFGAHAATHFSAAHGSGARLDRLYASPTLLAAGPARDPAIHPCPPVPSDHVPVSCRFFLPSAAVPRGTPLPSFPTHLLSLADAADTIRSHLEVSTQAVLSATGSQATVTAWTRLKHDVLRVGQTAARRHKAKAAATTENMERAAAKARVALAAMGPATDAEAEIHLAALRAACTAATDAWQDRADAALSSLAALHHVRGDSGSRYYHALARPAHPPTLVAKLNRPGRGQDEHADAADLSDASQVGKALGHADSFYSSASPIGLFHQRDTDAGAQERLLASLPRRLVGDAALEAEGPRADSIITHDELAWALRHARRGSTPGGDGLPYEFYAAFADLLSPVLLHVFNAVFLDTTEADPLGRMLEGIICLLHKAGKPADELEGYRPLTLLNADVKLLMLIIAARLQRPLEYLIDISQSAFLAHRDISDNVKYAQGLNARLAELGLPGWLLMSDLHKAYDSVNRGWLVATMRAMGFRSEGVVRWAQILLAGTTARVRLNRYVGAAFPVTSSLAQGSAVSCVEWVIVLQPLLSYLDSLAAQGRIRCIALPSGLPAPVALAYADDTTTSIIGEASDPSTADNGAVEVREAFDLFQAAGGPAQSLQKSALVPLHCPSGLPSTLDPAVVPLAASGYSLAVPGEPTRHLGVPIAAPLDACRAKAFTAAAGKLVAAGALWAPLRPPTIARAHIALACLASKHIFASTFHQPDGATLTSMQRVINRFVAGSDVSEEVSPYPGRLFPREAVARLPRARGGLNLPHLATAFRAMQAKCIWTLMGLHTSHPVWELMAHEIGQAARPHAPVPSGPAWIVAAPAAGSTARITTDSYRLAADAFLSLGITRVKALTAQGALSVRLELTYGNAATGLLTPEALTTATAATWTRLRDVMDAMTSLDPESAEWSDAQAIIARLPEAWRSALASGTSPEEDWSVLSGASDADVVAIGPAPGDPSTAGHLGRCLWEALPTGRLRRRLAPYVAPGPARPALVQLRPRPQHGFTQEDWEGYRQPLSQRVVPEDPWLIGAWDDLPVDPTVWGIGSDCLLDLSVRCVRAHLRDKAAASGPMAVEGFAAEGAAYPAAWPRLPPEPGPANAAPTGLPAIEARWTDSAQTASPAGTHGSEDGTSEDEDEGAPSWLALRAAGSPAPGSAERAARWQRRDEGHPVPRTLTAPLGAFTPGYKDAWARLKDATIHRPHSMVAWRILHASLGVRGFLFHVRRQGSPFCPLPCCAGQAHVDTLSHALLDCAAVAPAIDWLIATWLALTGLQAPRTAAFLLCDMPTAGWTGCGDDAWQLQQWTRLRVAVLGSIWWARCKAAAGQLGPVSLARQVTRRAATMVVTAIQRDWARAEGGRGLTHDYTAARWWSGESIVNTPEHFKRTWARGTAPAFCVLANGQLALRLTANGPVPHPP